MDKFEDAFKKISKVNLATHIELWGEPKTEKLYFEAGQQSRQAEINQLQSQINEMAEVGLSQESVIREKDKRIEELESALKKINENLDLHDCESCWQHYFEIEKVLLGLKRGEHE